MTRKEIFDKLTEVFRDVFDDESIIINDGTTADDIEEWDSLEHINLIVAIEQEFNVKFNMGATVKLKNVGGMVDYIEREIK